MLSDNQRRLICRLVFLLGCLAPTLSVVYWVFHRPTAADWARTIKAELGVQATIDSIETPLPGVTLLRGVKFFDPEVGTLFEATEVGIEIAERENRVIINQNLTVTNTGLIKLVQLINDHPIRRHVADRPWQFSLNGQTTIYDKNSSLHYGQPLVRTLTIEQTQLDLVPFPNKTELNVRFQLAENSRLREAQNRPFPQPFINAFLGRGHPYANGQSELVVKLETRGSSLPCWLVDELVPELRDLGKETCFEGSLELRPIETAQLWIKGRFTDFDQSKYARYGTFEALELICTIDGKLIDWNANLVDQGTHIPIQFSYPFHIEHAILAAQDDFFRRTTYR
jgi:hypothetical protein